MEKEKFNSPAHLLKPPPLSVSSNYEELELSRLGEGVFGTVSRFLKKDTSQIVAVKRLKDESCFDAKKEISILERLRSFGAHKCHIVQFHEHFQKDGHTCLVFEALDISLYDYMRQRDFVPLSLYDIRWIIKQLAVAFDTLKTMGLIHTDVKPDNIMLVDHEKKPLRVKLIDFGLAIPTCEAEQGAHLQPKYWRSPEILLGLQFSEAIDMWSLGCVMAEMLLGYPLFPGRCEYDVMRFIVQLLGPPPEHLLNAGLRTKRFFKKPFFSFRRHWRLMTPVEYRGVDAPDRETRRYDFRSLVQLKEARSTPPPQHQASATQDEARNCREQEQVNSPLTLRKLLNVPERHI
ncbi:homeodomain-interacting protein kinase 2-like [Myripristis murdjan]|uniref:homeodomain-interacting protein kinase 2-like n=1 Tax=Myripristis murdjan TaxID=586833 RepID=UPI001175D9A0|nr:homeodomain-interacting protein kinase 2-like [Myripristis murdjan]